MSAATPEQEPSIEEILASIRQIISDDDEGAPAASAAPEPVAPPPPPPPAPEPEPAAPKEDILELKDPLPEEKPVIEMVERPTPPPAPEPSVESILSEHAKEAAVTGFLKLASNIALERHRTAPGVTIEDIVRDMLQPMLREWLDENLPRMIERLVQKELEKLAQQAMDD
jgi:cell pole-organizing protein PopZ